MKVRVYWNLHKDMWSIKDKKANKLLGWSTSIILTDCTFPVSEAGRQRVLASGHKNVHAYIEGTLIDDIPPDDPIDMLEIGYNPKLGPSFVVKVNDTYTPVHKAGIMYLYPDRKALAPRVLIQ